MRQFAGVEDTDIRRGFDSGDYRYFSWVLAKPA